MGRHRYYAALILLASCATGEPVRNGTGAAKDDIAVTFEIDYTTSQPVEGELATFIVTVRNTGSSVVLLRDLVEGSAVLMTWQRSMPGVLKFRDSADEFSYDPRRPDKTSEDRFDPERPVFNTSMIVPGEEVIFKPRIRLLNLPKEYALNYWSFSTIDIKKEVYFLADRAARPMKFRRLLDDEACAKALLPDPTTSIGSHRTVVFPHAEKVLYAPRRLQFKLDAVIEKRAFSLDDAMRKARLGDGDAKEVSFYAGLTVWSVRTQDVCLWIGLNDVITLPPIDRLDVFCYALDSAGMDAISIELRGGLASALADGFPEFKVIATLDPRDSTRTRYTTLVAKTKLIPFLDAVRTMGCKLQITTGDSGFRILVTR